MGEFELVEIKLDKKSCNENGQSAIDCCGLWQCFLAQKIVTKIPNKISNEIFEVYDEKSSDCENEEIDIFISIKN